MIALHTCAFNRPPQKHKPYDNIIHMRIQQTTEQQAKPHDHITHMRIHQTTTEAQAI